MEDLKKKRKYIILGIALLVIVLLGSSYAFFTYTREIEAFTITSSSIKATFESGTNSISFKDAYPISDNFALNNLNNLTYIDFTVSSEVSDINQAVEYEIFLTEEDGNTLSSDFVKVYLTNDNNQEISGPSIYSSLDNTTYKSSSNGKVIYKDNNSGKFTKDYRLFVWLDSSYSQNEVSQTFSFKVNIYAYNVNHEPTGAEVIIEKVVPYAESNANDFTGGLVGINSSGTLYNETTTEEVREYRYSGPSVDNYAYFNCKDNDGKYAYGHDNYDYANNCEVWRIVGIFKNSKGKWNLKLMRNTMLTTDELPETYVIDGTTYTIVYSATDANAYWNSPDTLKSTNYNDWTAGGLQYFLNTTSDTNGTAGYYSTFTTKTKELIDENYTYYLGNFVYNTDTATTGYATERDATKIWSGNQPSWNGAVALLYPSDYGYSALSSNWNTAIYDYDGGAMDTSWMYKEANHTPYEWLLSPSSYSSNSVTYCSSSGYVGDDYVDYGVHGYFGVRPVLNLKSNTKILKGDGTDVSPYVIVGEYEPTGADKIIEKIVPYAESSASDFAGGLVGINTSGTLYNETTTEEVREYRYIGPSVNNYAYFNCKDTDGTYNYGDDNYNYQNNCETWRIVGTFKNANNEWNLKLMRNTMLTTDEIPETYVVDGTTYTIEEGTTGYAYWNNPDTLKSTNYNDWWTAGLQYFLNRESDTNGTAGYYGALSSKTKELIDENYTYYLGNVYHSLTTEVAYGAERGVVECSNSVTSNTHDNSCNIWNGNQAIWNGAIGLLYASDYGYSTLSSYWKGTILSSYNSVAAATSWMYKEANHTTSEWLLSPSSSRTIYAMYWNSDEYVTDGYVLAYGGVRPVLNLKSNTKILKGDGTENLPYVFIGE